MGDTGPCGPCTEIFYDHGPDVPGGPPGSPDEDGDRFVEIWNLVFMQFDRSPDGKQSPLPKPSVDTGDGTRAHRRRHAGGAFGLRDRPLQEPHRGGGRPRRHPRSGPRARCGSSPITSAPARSSIVDGVVPSNEGRGYVLRRIIRRAVRHGYQLGIREPFFHKLVPVLEREMGAAYPELTRARPPGGARAGAGGGAVRRDARHRDGAARGGDCEARPNVIRACGRLTPASASATPQVVPGHAVFKLYDTYGFPVDLTADIARERGADDRPGRVRCGDGRAA